MSKSRDKNITSVDIGVLCEKSLPCGHCVTISYQDGTKEEKNLDASVIIKEYGEYLSKEDKKHFDYLKESDYVFSNELFKRKREAAFTSFFKPGAPRVDAEENVNQPRNSCVII